MQASAPPGATLPGSGASTAWSGLEQALRALRISKHIYPPLGLALDDLTSHLPKFEVSNIPVYNRADDVTEAYLEAAARNRQDYDDLAIELKGMAELIERQLDAMISEESKRAIVSLSETIRAELKSVEGRQSQSGTRRVLDSLEEDEDIIRRYRRVEQLFRQLQGEASLSTWCTTNKYYMNTQLEGLRPARLARYDSSLSMEIGRRTCTENTRTKILQDSMKWSEDPNSAKIYWMNGMAGTGKTTIVYSLATILEARKQLAASFFCTRISPECREAKQIVPTIAYQLARRSAPFRHALCEALEEDPDIGFGRISSQFELLLKRPLVKIKDELPDNFVVVIDALDECNDPGIVEDFLNLLFRSVADLPIRFYVTSRPEPTIRDRMMAASECSRSILYLHEIERSLVQADIELYLREELAFMSPPDPDIKKLASHAGNLFIYAATAVRYIRPTKKGADSWTRLSVLLAINAESKQKLSGINDLYTAILGAAVDDQLEHHENARILDALWTVVCAYEPIRVSTLTALCGLENLDSIRTALQPLRSVLHVSDHSELVTTLHASFPDYVLDQERSGRFHCDKVAHGQYLAKRCFEIMQRQLRFNIGDIKSSYIPDDEIPEIKETICANISEELSYGCRFWIDHLTQTKLKPADILDLLA
ncbi:unnamed protein product [Rhizoctonia solani]|uniref:NACHT domain-containing protein n=1 Tax=Rhizoctonia solani TaxID=456999 RepID=A0A8H3G9F9_9AGAM|nr:unnamed protein product [Rhizoctonia solani]